ncbi:hypothetical protein FSP39_021472 [Pinctada imbricata]|uniref:G-protein coupled receptors family 2 profile 2 domain-containing protein n=1 Tax=Pinctada imbricata TaxID=66713 RepID=A0AA89BWC4_PINIB|nr:hypothetical protein FSP39_021472 [Pinctada imbricata]
MIYSVLTATASSLSVFGGLGLILVYILFKDMRTGGRKLLMFIAMMDALTAIGNILGVIWLHCRTTPSCRNVYESMTFCRFHAILTIFSSISSNLWMVVMGTCLLVSIVHTKPNFAMQHMKKFYFICWPIAGFIAIVTLAANVVGFDPGIASWCWIDPNTPNMLAWQFFTGKLWEMLTYVITVVIYTYVRVYLWKRTSHSLAHQKQRSRQAALQDANRKLTFVPCVFIVLRIWGSLRFLLGSIAGYNSPWIAYLQVKIFVFCIYELNPYILDKKVRDHSRSK